MWLYRLYKKSDNCRKGQKSAMVFRVLFGILDFTLFPDTPEFYATYKLMNIKNHHIFNDKFILSVLSLKEIEKATSEDMEWGLDTWARFFAAKTWRDIKMIAKNNEILTSASKSLYEYNSNWLVREQCRAREDFECHERTMQKRLAEQSNTIAEQSNTIAEKELRIQELEALLENQKSKPN